MKKISKYVLTALFLCSSASFASTEEHSTPQIGNSKPTFATEVALDLYGNSDMQTVTLPAPYCPAKENDKITYVRPGEYFSGTIDPNSHEILIAPVTISPFVVVASGDKILAFNVDIASSLSDLSTIIHETFPVNKSHSLIRGKSLRAPFQHLTAAVSVNNISEMDYDNYKSKHNGKTPEEYIQEINYILIQSGCDIMKLQSEIYPMMDKDGSTRYPDGFLGNYEHAEIFRAVRLDDLWSDNGLLKIFSIDPLHDGSLYTKMSPICPEKFVWANNKYSQQLERIKMSAIEFWANGKPTGYNYRPFTEVTGHELDDFIHEKKTQQEQTRKDDLKQRLKQAKRKNNRKK